MKLNDDQLGQLEDAMEGSTHDSGQFDNFWWSNRVWDVVVPAIAPLIESWLSPAPCEMTHTPPFDFAQCETHDTTFPLGETCKFDGREVWEVFAEEADEQRQRAVMAEITSVRCPECRAPLEHCSTCGTTFSVWDLA